MASNPYDFSFSLRKQLQKKIIFVISVVFLILLLMNLVLAFLIFPMRMDSEAMMPGIQENSFMFVAPCRSSLNISLLDRNLERGDVVYVAPADEDSLSVPKKILNAVVAFLSFQQYRPYEPENALTGNSSVRRVVGMPGDSVYMKDYVLYIKPAGEQHYLTEFEIVPNRYETLHNSRAANEYNVGIPSETDEIVLGENEYYLLADDRVSSVDSRIYGPVHKYSIAGKALLRYFPFSSFGLL